MNCKQNCDVYLISFKMKRQDYFRPCIYFKKWTSLCLLKMFESLKSLQDFRRITSEIKKKIYNYCDGPVLQDLLGSTINNLKLVLSIGDLH